MSHEEVLARFNMSARTMDEAVQNCNWMYKHQNTLERAAIANKFKPTRKNCPPGICVDDWIGLATPSSFTLPE